MNDSLPLYSVESLPLYSVESTLESTTHSIEVIAVLESHLWPFWEKSDLGLSIKLSQGICFELRNNNQVQVQYLTRKMSYSRIVIAIMGMSYIMAQSLVVRTSFS